MCVPTRGTDTKLQMPNKTHFFLFIFHRAKRRYFQQRADLWEKMNQRSIYYKEEIQKRCTLNLFSSTKDEASVTDPLDVKKKRGFPASDEFLYVI